MKTKLFLATLLSFAFGLTLAACDEDGDGGGGSVCKQAGDILVDDCGLDTSDGGDGDGGSAECEGDIEAAAQCIVDYPDQACASINDPTNTDAYADYASCLQG